jgi:hypothetical protein
LIDLSELSEEIRSGIGSGIGSRIWSGIGINPHRGEVVAERCRLGHKRRCQLRGSLVWTNPHIHRRISDFFFHTIEAGDRGITAAAIVGRVIANQFRSLLGLKLMNWSATFGFPLTFNVYRLPLICCD